MKTAIKITPEAIKRIINIQWLFLIIYVIIKFLGGNYFEIVCENESFVNACQFIDNHLWLKIITCCISSYIMIGFLYLSIIRQAKFNTKQLILFLILIPVETILKLTTNDIISVICDFVVCFVTPIILMPLNKNEIDIKWFIFYYLLGNVLNILFQLASAFIKDLILKIMDESTLITLIFGFDVFIMLSLYYSYVLLIEKRKEMK